MPNRKRPPRKVAKHSQGSSHPSKSYGQTRKSKARHAPRGQQPSGHRDHDLHHYFPPSAFSEQLQGPPLYEIGYRQCHKLLLLQKNRVKDWLLLEEEFLQNVQQRLNDLAERREQQLAFSRTGAHTDQPKSTQPKKTSMPAAFQLAHQTERSGPLPQRMRPADPLPEEELTVELIRGSPMVVGRLEQIVDEDHAVITLEDGSEWYLPILSIVDRELLKPDCRLLLRGDLEAVVGVVPDDLLLEGAVRDMKITLKPDVSFEQVGGLDQQIQELREVIELPLTHPELYDAIGISPPKGVLLYGPPGTGKTMLVKAVARRTQAAFFYTSASKLVNKTSGPRVVRELFKLANQNAPSIVFIDEIDAVGTRRSCMEGRNGEREIQRTMLELLNQLDGFDASREVKIILVTNRVDLLDPALIRPGRIDRKIAIPTPNWAGALHIFRLHTSRMRLADDVRPAEVLPAELFSSGGTDDDQRMRPLRDHCPGQGRNQSDADRPGPSSGFSRHSVRPVDLLGDDWTQQLSGADIAEICNQAGMLALRARALRVHQEHFVAARELLLDKRTQKATATPGKSSMMFT